ncbi:DUF4097 family beta strand repeat-containing protein [Dactylosporangium sp. AC04546]|uniref:DUF4097 family beta strand repeat-containing protein n=1 Tax=Dactylosporangium sp. AC04546 TaxID=2862460 RepID=UPI001EDD5DDB|nr:DUF4097 family beta strand repeat-containing protein [Dactylosporangium sp. AC04546]WVK86742.1 DUF4097 family beta strand repeat-containing protein [Dactylosporangium sp. AC04546]
MTRPNHPTRTLLAAVAAALTLIAATGCGASADDAEPEKRNFGPVADRLTITKTNGDLDVRPADVDEVEVTRWFSGRDGIRGDAEATWELAGERLTLATKCGAIIGPCNVRYEVLVPDGVALTVEGENGKITASGFGTALRIRSANGAVAVDDVSGPLTLNSDSGELRATGITSGRVEAGTQNGKVHLSFAAVPDDVTVTTNNGAVTVEVPNSTYKAITATDSDEVRVDLPQDANSPHAITIQTDNGAITLRTPQ